MIEVIHPGLLTTIQDDGRKGYERYGFPQSGFFDPFLAAIANRMVGNRLDAPLLEFALIGPTLRFMRAASVAVIGFDVDYDCDGAVQRNPSMFLKEGTTMRFVAMKGWFGYIAISGGILAKKMLGSASTYFAGGLGARLERNAKLAFGEDNREIWHLRQDRWNLPKHGNLQLLPAQHTLEFEERERETISNVDYQINSQSNRMGIRLEGQTIQSPNVQRSVPTLPGVVQIPGGGLPIILAPEGPTTGGYPQLGMLSRTSWTVLAGTPPGSKIRFQWTEPEAAKAEWDQRQSLLTDLKAWER